MAGRQLLSQQIGGDSCARLTFRRGCPMPPTASRQALFSHQRRSSLARTRDPLLPQFCMNARASVHLPTGVVDGMNVLCQLLVFPLMLTDGTLLPGIRATQGHSKRLTQYANWILLALLFHHLIPHSWPCEKIVTVFFSLSRAFRVRSSSRLRRRFSSSKAVWCPLPGNASGPCSASSLRH
jgi:hypothetical protein